MLLFWLLAAGLAAGSAVLVIMGAARAEQTAAPDPGLEVYRRQLDEIEDLAARGLLGEEERKAARAEAGRRLIRQADLRAGEAEEGARAAPFGARGRRLAIAAAMLAPALALAGYLVIGSPGVPDQPFKPRLQAWTRTAARDPGRLTLPELTAVLEAAAAKRPSDPQGWAFLGRFQLEMGDAPSAVRSLQKAAALAPRDPAIWARLGEALVVEGKGEVTPEARQAFEQARALDPAAPGPRYMLARARIAAGDGAGGLAELRALLGVIPAGDPAHKALEDEVAYVERNGRLPSLGSAAAPAEGGSSQQAAFIQAMVDRLAARLKAQPDDPEGWARLIRAYGVLGQEDRRQAAIDQARRVFKDRPDALKTALAGEAAPPP